uniref:mitogen-activated protein kinase kinase n=1 Tax=Elaeophora elaphi TaxID=1147741 RepID=A0A0R3RWK1_9BILA
MAERPMSLDVGRFNLKLDFPPLPDVKTSPQLAYLRTHSAGKLRFSPGKEYEFTCNDLIDKGEIGRGNFGTVSRMLHAKSGTVLAVKNEFVVQRIRSNTVNSTEQKHLLMELEAIMSSQCENIVRFYGAIFTEGDCWICMELMDISLENLYKIVYGKGSYLPEDMIGYVAVSTVNALSYLKEDLRIIHRDVKPSNILLDRKGHIKLCDFGIAGHLIDSIAKTQDAGCRPYMAPERLQSNEPYDVRSDVWSLGITLFEVSTGRFPFSAWDSPFQQLQEVVNGEPPIMPPGIYSTCLVTFINHCLIKGKDERPKYNVLMTMDFYKTYNVQDANGIAQAQAIVGIFVSNVLGDGSTNGSNNACKALRSDWIHFS